MKAKYITWACKIVAPVFAIVAFFICSCVLQRTDMYVGIAIVSGIIAGGSLPIDISMLVRSVKENKDAA